ncbi:substance-K receptor-like [Stylophora pistillata]|uniref:substance-K receptor-like n=1 Tax=Stylophora pistillata TaxID=50429 RepID=UPI000C047DA2|nr:substance-K receptor-like [Stylophora pistillata]
MNNSNSSSGKGGDSVKLFIDTSRIITTTDYAVTIICGLVGNGLGISLALRRKAGNRATNLLITNMAAADLLVTLFAMPYSVLLINVGQQWIGGVIGQVTCKFVHFAYQISIPASIFTVLLVSFDRYFAICYPMKANVFRNGKVMTTTIWISSAAYAVPFMMANDILEDNDASYCLRIFSPLDNQKSRQTYYLVTFILLYFVPLTILLVLYSLITHRLWQRKIPGNVSKARIRSAQREKRRIIKALILIVVVFAICWFPAHAMHYLVYYRTDIYRSISVEVEIFFFWLCHANSIINPCLYVLMCPSYRKFIQRSFGRFCSCCSHANFNSFRRRSTGMLTLSRSLDATSTTVVGFSFKIKDAMDTRL